VTEQLPKGIHRTAAGVHSFGREEYDIRNGEILFKNSGPIWVMVTEKQVGRRSEPTGPTPAHTPQGGVISHVQAGQSYGCES